MSEETNAGAESQNNEGNFDEFVGKDQPVIIDNQGASEDEKSKEEQPKPAEGEKPEEKPTEVKPDEGEPKDGELFWGKFKSPDEAKKSYDEAQTKIIDQGTKVNELAKQNEENTKLLTAIDGALAKNPELAEQLKQALADVGEVKDDKPGDIDSLLDRKLEEREKSKQLKADREEWVKAHPDFNENSGELGHKILDLLEGEGLSVTAKTLQMAYDHLTKDTKIESAKKTAAEEALKKEEIAELDRQNGSAVGGGNADAKKEPTQENPFDDLVGKTFNPNSIRT